MVLCDCHDCPELQGIKERMQRRRVQLKQRAPLITAVKSLVTFRCVCFSMERQLVVVTLLTGST